MKCSFALLSGGSSRRFVSDKTKALLYGKPLFLYGLECGLEVSDDVLHISKNKDKYKPFINNVKYIEDELDVICPMSGLITAARHAKYEYIFILSADSPLITGNFFKYLYNNIKSYDGVMPVINSKSYPLTAVYKKSILFVDDLNNYLSLEQTNYILNMFSDKDKNVHNSQLITTVSSYSTYDFDDIYCDNKFEVDKSNGFSSTIFKL